MISVYLEKSINVINLFSVILAILISSSILLFAVFLKYAYRRHQLSKYFPSKIHAFFNILGSAAEPFLVKRHIPHFSMVTLKLCGDYIKLFKKEKFFCIWGSYMPILIFIKAEAVEDLIGSSKNLKKGFMYNFIHPWLGTGLLTSDGKKWKTRRKLLTPSFHFEILKDFLPVFNEQSQTLVNNLRKEVSKGYVDIVMPITLCSLDIICETTLGVKIGAQENEHSEYIKAVTRISNVIMERTINMFYWLDATFMFSPYGRQIKKDIQLLHNFTDLVIQEKKEKLLKGDMESVSKKKRKALMDVLLEHHIQIKDLSETDIREEVDTFTFEGHDTTSMGMSWVLYLIGLYRDVQDKLHEEIDSIFGGDTERPVTTDDIKDMPYLDRVLKESQRLYPSVPFIMREITTDDVTICGYNIPKDMQCVISTYYLHRDETVFPDPEKFDPDRFLPENSAKRHPFAYIPFSAGPRNCIGQRFAVLEEKVVVTNILRNFTLKSLDPREKLLPVAEVILRPSIPIRIKIRPRK